MELGDAAPGDAYRRSLQVSVTRGLAELGNALEAGHLDEARAACATVMGSLVLLPVSRADPEAREKFVDLTERLMMAQARQTRRAEPPRLDVSVDDPASGLTLYRTLAFFAGSNEVKPLGSSTAGGDAPANWQPYAEQFDPTAVLQMMSVGRAQGSFVNGPVAGNSTRLLESLSAGQVPFIALENHPSEVIVRGPYALVRSNLALWFRPEEPPFEGTVVYFLQVNLSTGLIQHGADAGGRPPDFPTPTDPLEVGLDALWAQDRRPPEPLTPRHLEGLIAAARAGSGASPPAPQRPPDQEEWN